MEFTLGMQELRMRPLPPVCMCCGRPATLWKPKTFAWYPPWVLATMAAGLLIFAIVAAVTTKRAPMNVPLCHDHRNHFLPRPLIGWLGALGFFVWIAIVISIIANLHGYHNDGTILALVLSIPGYLVAWIVAMVVVNLGRVRPAEITDFYVRLKDVHPDFISAYQALGPIPGVMPYGVGPYGMHPGFRSPY